jgi:PAS domain S-box-containing protein
MPLVKGPSHETLKALETVPNMYLVLSPELYILTASDLYLEATKTTRESILNKHIFEAFPDNPDHPEADGSQNINASLQEVLKTKRPHYMRIQRYDVPDVTSPGKFIQRYWDPSHTPILDEQGEIQYIIQLATNVTDMVLAESALAQSTKDLRTLNDKLDDANEEIKTAHDELLSTVEALKLFNQNLESNVAYRTRELEIATKKVEKAEMQLRMAIEAAKIGLWYINPETRELEYSTVAAEIFGYEGERPMTFKESVEQVVEEHRERLVEAIDEAIAGGGEFSVTYAQRRFNDGQIVWLRSLGKVSRDESGQPAMFSGVVMDITEQKQDDLRKSDFIGMVSHELKTPLTSLSAYLQMLQQKAVKEGDDFRLNSLNQCFKQVKKMSNMINGFLNVSRLESGKIHIDKERFDMKDLVKEIEDELVAVMSSHHVIFAPVVTTYVNADRDKIGQVITNFIDNAVKYSPKGSTINVACLTVEGKAMVSIQDEGMGIEQYDVDKLFQRYYRVKGNHTQSIAGFGIGLYLCSEIIARHGGDIGVSSEIGRGSNFWFTLPVID